jgi:hypothetical protein
MLTVNTCMYVCMLMSLLVLSHSEQGGIGGGAVNASEREHAHHSPGDTPGGVGGCNMHPTTPCPPEGWAAHAHTPSCIGLVPGKRGSPGGLNVGGELDL